MAILIREPREASEAKGNSFHLNFVNSTYLYSTLIANDVHNFSPESEPLPNRPYKTIATCFVARIRICPIGTIHCCSDKREVQLLNEKTNANFNCGPFQSISRRLFVKPRIVALADGCVNS